MGHFYALFYTSGGHICSPWYLIDNELYEDKTCPAGTPTLLLALTS